MFILFQYDSYWIACDIPRNYGLPLRETTNLLVLQRRTLRLHKFIFFFMSPSSIINKNHYTLSQIYPLSSYQSLRLTIMGQNSHLQKKISHFILGVVALLQLENNLLSGR